MNIKSAVYLTFLCLCHLVLLRADLPQGRQRTKSHTNKKLLLILVDGFRHDYADRDTTLVAFPKMAKLGVRANLKPIFPANSYPNHYALVTGLYAESHGIVENVMFDKERQEYFNYSTLWQPFWWEEAEPLWRRAESSGIRSGMFYWDGCQSNQGMKASVCKPYVDITQWETVNEDTESIFDRVLDGFEEDEFGLAQVYYEQVDNYGHLSGPEGDLTKKAVRDIDEILNKVITRIEETSLSEEVNVIVVSDHGMIAYNDSNKYIDIEECFDEGSLEAKVLRLTTAMFLPKEDKFDEVFEGLMNCEGAKSGLRIFKKGTIPTEFHIRKHKRVLPIYVTVVPGYFMLSNKSETGGTHGLNPDEVPEMTGIFYAFGPDFKSNAVIEPLKIIDLYNLFTHLLKTSYASNNGSWESVKKVLKDTNSAAGLPYKMNYQFLTTILLTKLLAFIIS